MDEKRDETMDIAKLRKLAEESAKTPYVPKDEFEDEETEVVGSDWMNNASGTQKPEPTEEPEVVEAVEEAPEETSTDTEYDGPGMVIEKDEIPEPVQPEYTGIATPVLSHINEYINDMEDETKRLEEEVEEIAEKVGVELPEEIKPKGKNKHHEYDEYLDDEYNEEDDEDEEVLVNKFIDDEEEYDDDEDDEDEEYTEEEFKKVYKEAVVIIDKTNIGGLSGFTDEERAKLHKSKVIKLEEVENVELNSIKIKKPKKRKDVDNILKNIATTRHSNVVLPVSGYTATLSGFSAYELATLATTGENRLLEAQTQWSLIHSKVQSTSLGKMDFTEFLHNTAPQDMSNFIYGLLCATYPDDDSIPVKCPKCKKNFDHHYTTKSLIRVEEMSDTLKDRIMDTVDASYLESTAKEHHAKSPLMTVRRIKLPGSGIIMDLHIQSVYEFINRTIKDLADKTRETDKYFDAAMASTLVKAAYIPTDEIDEDGDVVYVELTSSVNLTKTIYNLPDVDLSVLNKYSDEILSDTNITYGIMDIKCPHCGHYTPSMEMDIQYMLFYRYQQAITTKIK